VNPQKHNAFDYCALRFCGFTCPRPPRSGGVRDARRGRVDGLEL